MAVTEGQGAPSDGGSTAVLEEGSGAAELDESAAAGVEPEAAETETEAPDQIGDADEDELEAAGEPDAAAATATDEEEQTPYVPHSYVVGSGRPQEFPGVFKGPDGSLYVHPEAVETVNQAFQQAWLFQNQSQKEVATLRRQLVESKNRFDENAVKNEATAKWWANLWSQGPEVWDQFKNNYQYKLPELIAAQKEARAQAILDQAKQLQQPDPESQQQQEAEKTEGTVRGVVMDLMNRPDLKEQLTEDQFEQFGNYLWNNRGLMFFRAQGNEGPNIQKGQLVYNTDYVDSALRWYVQAIGAKQQTEAKVNEARQFNQRTVKRLPPAVSTRAPSPAGRTGNKVPKFKSRQEWQDWLLTHDKEEGEASIVNATA